MGHKDTKGDGITMERSAKNEYPTYEHTKARENWKAKVIDDWI